MKNFEKFVKHVVSKWRQEKTILLSEHGLSGLPNRKYGDKAEAYIRRKVAALTPNYSAYISPGSQSPADIIAVARRNGYWHIMLIQVKSSSTENGIYELNVSDKKVFNQFAQLVKKEVRNFPGLKDYADKPLVITSGYAGVKRVEKPFLRHYLIKTQPYKLYRQNTSQLDLDKLKDAVKKAHRLGIE